MVNVDELERQFVEAEYQQYMADVLEKNAQRRQDNPVITRPAPEHPKFSEEAEAKRQLKAQEKADKTKLPLQDLEVGYLQSLERRPTIPALPPVSETQLNPEGFTPTPSPMAETLGPLIREIPGLETGLDYMTAPGDYLRGYLSGMSGERVDPYTFMGATDPGQMSRVEGGLRGAVGMLVDPLTIAAPLIGGFAAGLLRKNAPRTIPAIEPFTDDVDASLAGRIQGRTGEPDYTVPGPRTEETGRTITVPALEPGEKTGEVTAKSARTGRPLVQQVPGTTPGEYGPEQQTLLAAEPIIPGKRVLEPEEQLSTGEVPLRPQVMRKPAFPEDTTAKAVEPVTQALQKISKREEGKRLLRESFAPQQDYRLTLQTSPRGSVSVTEAEKDSGLRYSKIPGIPSDTPLVFPGWPSRTTQAITDTFKEMGVPGENIGNAIETILSNRAVLSTNDVRNTTTQLVNVAGVRGVPSRFIEGFRELGQGENAFIWGTHRFFNMTEQEVEQAWNYLYTQGRMVPASTKARTFADELYKGMLYGPSVAAHEAGLKLYNPLTGKHYPFGAPSMFMPQVPVHPTSIHAISDTHLQLLYARQGGFEGTGKSFPLWKSQLSRVLSQGGELREMKAAGQSFEDAAVAYDLASKRYKGLEVTRLLDLEALGGSPYQWAKKLGYETDPFRAAFRYNSSAYLRAEWAKALPQIEQDMALLAEKGGTDLTEWAAKAIDRSQGINTGLTETRLLRQVVKGVRDFNNATLLQLGSLGSAPQLGYALGRAPLTKSFLGAVDFVSKNNRNLVEQSGALFPSLLNTMIQPEGPLATVSTGALRTYGVSMLDKWSRYFGGHVGVRYVDFLEKALLKYPGKERLHTLVEEMGGDVNAILKEGSIPEPMKLAMIQRYANYAAGIPDPRGLPLIATNETAHWRLANQYRTFMFNNQAELVRLWKQAPTLHDAVERITKVVLGTGATAAVTGGLSEFIRNSFSDEQGNPFVNKRLNKIVGDEGAAFAIQTLIYGMGALFGSLTLTALDNGWKLAAQLTGGPTASLVAGAAEDMVDTLINGPGWKSTRTLSRRVPYVGPVVAPFVREEIKEETRMEKKREQLRRSLIPESGFPNQP